MARHELVTYPNGSVSMRHVASGQTMHSLIGPWQEATRLYSLQSRLRERLEAPAAGPLVLYDVGMGVAANAIAAAQCAGGRGLRLFSFESDVEGLETALARADAFPFLAGWEPALRALLDGGEWLGTPGLEWRLLRGDFFERLRDAPAPEVAFWDFYAPQSCPGLWNIAAFSRLRARCADTDLYTYAASTAARAAMLLAGWFVGKGESTEKKSDTTVASTSLARVPRPLGRDWLEKVARSSHPAPDDWNGTREGLLEALTARPQFRPSR